jgi:hypothetical protein
MLEGDRDRFDVGVGGAARMGDERAGIDRDQERSLRSVRRSTENLTRPPQCAQLLVGGAGNDQGEALTNRVADALARALSRALEQRLVHVHGDFLGGHGANLSARLP